ncbi:MAG: hypothetical protein L6R37_005319 [Teloschistes peruensis]|nr:MAG: hypothetical protein L6R37_005319 [Teloschistes peruensis]
MPQQQHLPSLEQGSQKFGRYEAIRIPIHHDLLKDQPPNSSTSSHSQHPMTHNSSVPSALSSPANHEGFQPTSPALVSELSGQSTPTPELSPNPERLQINRGRPRTSTVVEGVDGILPVPKVSENGRMRPNLEMTGDEHSGGKPSHVTSWMSYGNGAAGPVR